MTHKNIIATVLGFFVTLFANTLLAMFVLQNFSEELLISRTLGQGLNFPALLSGYFLVGVFMVWLMNIAYKSKDPQETWLQVTIKTGVCTALVFNVASYLVVSGWSIASAPHMLLAALIDSIATILGALAIGFYFKKVYETRK